MKLSLFIVLASTVLAVSACVVDPYGYDEPANYAHDGGAHRGEEARRHEDARRYETNRYDANDYRDRHDPAPYDRH